MMKTETIVLTEDMIRVVRHSIGAKGRMVRDRAYHVFVGYHCLKDARGRLRRFSSQSTARAAARVFIMQRSAK